LTDLTLAGIAFRAPYFMENPFRSRLDSSEAVSLAATVFRVYAPWAHESHLAPPASSPVMRYSSKAIRSSKMVERKVA
jgi:hypothetical protein